MARRTSTKFSDGFSQHCLFSVKNGAGFTLIELLVVIAIISVLASIVLASLSTARGKARDARRLEDMTQIRNALELYSLSNNSSYPTQTTVEGNLAGWEVSFVSNFMEYLSPAFIQKVPLDPINSGPPSSMFAPRPDGTFFYTYYYYPVGSAYGCAWNSAFGVLGFRAFEKTNADNLPKAKCGPQPCAGGGVADVCRDWSTEFDYSVFVVP